MISADLGKQLEAYIQQLVDAGRYRSNCGGRDLNDEQTTRDQRQYP